MCRALSLLALGLGGRRRRDKRSRARRRPEASGLRRAVVNRPSATPAIRAPSRRRTRRLRGRRQSEARTYGGPSPPSTDAHRRGVVATVPVPRQGIVLEVAPSTVRGRRREGAVPAAGGAPPLRRLSGQRVGVLWVQQRGGSRTASGTTTPPTSGSGHSSSAWTTASRRPCGLGGSS